MKWLAALLIVPVAAFIASCGLFHKTSAPPAGIGQEALDGKFAFIVSNVDTAPTFGNTSAHGVYVIVSMAVRNVGSDAQAFEMAAQKLKDSTGRKYLASFVDPSPLGDGNSINPGLQVSVKAVFDVPPDARPTQIVLHDSASSHGVPVNLTPRPPGG
jgi:hypothetical protein